MTSAGSAFARGTIFKMTPAGAITTLHSFGDGEEGSVPYGSLMQGSDGRFYGDTSMGGSASAEVLLTLAP